MATLSRLEEQKGLLAFRVLDDQLRNKLVEVLSVKQSRKIGIGSPRFLCTIKTTDTVKYEPTE